MANRWTRRRFSATGAAVLASAAADAKINRVGVVEGYPDKRSYAPGETVALHVSSSVPRFDVEVARVGATRQVVWKREGVAGSAFPTPANASSHGCDWPVAVSLKLTDVPSGYYAVRFSASDGGSASETFFVVRSATPGVRTPILLQLATNTYNAYCNWGGYSLYAYNGRERVQGRRVSFRRPLAGDFFRWEHAFVAWAERHGYTIDLATNLDLEERPEMLSRYRLVLSVGHDEYWSSPMRDALEGFIERGGNAAFFSGNTCCWQVRAEESGHALVCFKQSFGDDPLFRTGPRRLLTTLWSHRLVERPENRLTGVGFLFGGYHRSHGQFMDGAGAYTVHRPDHWLFAGTDLERGAEFGGAHTVVGYECDGCEFEWQDGLPVPTGRDGTPTDFTIVATAPARWHPDDCEWYDAWPKGREGAAVMGSYTRNGTVVTVGSTDWSHGLAGGDRAVQRITRNVLERLSRPSV